jgi:hypothetical protein
VAERQRRTKAQRAKSPMPDQKYDFERDELSLLKPVRHPLDAKLAALCKRYAKSSDQKRAAMRSAIRANHYDTLLEFAHRAAVFAVRERKAAWAVDGLTAVTMIEAKRAADWRDILMALGPLHHAATRAGLKADQLFREMSALAEPGMVKLLEDLRTRPRGEKELGAWGYEEIETEEGVGFVEGEFGRIKPKIDLIAIASKIADHLKAERYRSPSIEAGESILRNRLESRNNVALDEALRACRTNVLIAANMRRSKGMESYLLVSLHEMKSKAAARRLLEIARKKKFNPERECKVELAEGRLFCLVVAQPKWSDVPSYETPESLARFATPIGDILRRHTVK